MLEMVSLAVKVELTMLMLSEFPVRRRRRMSLRVGSCRTFYERIVLQTYCSASGTCWPLGYLNTSLDSAGSFGDDKNACVIVHEISLPVSMYERDYLRYVKSQTRGPQETVLLVN